MIIVSKFETFDREISIEQKIFSQMMRNIRAHNKLKVFLVFACADIFFL